MEKTIVQFTSELEMLGFLKSNGTACRFVSMVIDTPVTNMRKASPFKGVRKVSRKMGIINANYNMAVRRRIAERLGVKLKEIEYTNGKVWYKHLTTKDGKSLPVVVNATKETGKHYLQYFPHKSSHQYVMPNGDIVAEEKIKPWLYKESDRPNFKPAVISVDLANILQLKCSGVVIEMPDFEEAEAILAQ